MAWRWQSTWLGESARSRWRRGRSGPAVAIDLAGRIGPEWNGGGTQWPGGGNRPGWNNRPGIGGGNIGQIGDNLGVVNRPNYGGNTFINGGGGWGGGNWGLGGTNINTNITNTNINNNVFNRGWGRWLGWRLGWRLRRFRRLVAAGEVATAVSAADMARATTATGTVAAGAAIGSSGPDSARELSPPSAWVLSARCWVTRGLTAGYGYPVYGGYGGYAATESMITSRPGVRATTPVGDWARWPITGCTVAIPILTTRLVQAQPHDHRCVRLLTADQRHC